jgi:hypothetical protein
VETVEAVGREVESDIDFVERIGGINTFIASLQQNAKCNRELSLFPSLSLLSLSLSLILSLSLSLSLSLILSLSFGVEFKCWYEDESGSCSDGWFEEESGSDGSESGSNGREG